MGVAAPCSEVVKKRGRGGVKIVLVSFHFWGWGYSWGYTWVHYTPYDYPPPRAK